MTEIQWFNAYPPRDLTLAEVTGLVRVLGGRPRRGIRQLQPVVAFELWLGKDQVRWLIGIEADIATSLRDQLLAQLPGLILTRADSPERPTPVTAREVRPSSVSHPLRLDTAGGVAAGLLHLSDELHSKEQIVVQWLVGPSHTYTRQPSPMTPLDLLGITTPQRPDAGDRQGWKQKLSEAFLLGVRGRIGAVTANPKRGAALLTSALTVLSLANGPRTQIRATQQSGQTATQLIRVMARRRSWSGMVNAAELATLLGWPLADVAAPGATGTFAPPPASLLVANPTPERMLGTSQHPATEGRLVHLPWSSYAGHAHLIGPSGVGKSTLLANWAERDVAAGRSLLLVDPKGDLVADVLARLPAGRRDDVVVIDPGAEGPVVGINPVSGPRIDAERRADSLLQLFRDLFGTAIGPRSADVLLHALIAICRLDDGTLPDVPVFLTNATFRRRVLSSVSDPLVLDPWAAWFDAISEAERANVVAPVLNKLRAVTSRPSVRRMLSQPSPRFQLDQLFTSTPPIVLVNLNAGMVGKETAGLIGSVLLSQLWEAIQRQTAKPADQRREVTVIVDEWQQFTAGLDFADVLARARGAKTSFTVAHQHLGQLNAELRTAVLANARSRVVFRPADGDAPTLARVLGKPVTSHDLEHLPAFHAVARVLTEGAPSAAFDVATPPLRKPISDGDAVRRLSAERYGIAPEELDAIVLKRWHGEDAPPETPIGTRRKRS
ncbi:type IV secretory system conjugative DNA transfer family protein [Amycolatopsis sp. H20-H5]|uniref:type IV secretory system conjugative DNA transfer family protein n=1 Tax=Amycolatopsis sp. H20-H5 TaxID=3046309 RepID=UPI002DB9E073|nr:type IV secretory system conjugative DNA transfer family protein [Amycolatopsis sp. H20-H5]MEC3979535.1 type IV secretory system conjugative DNA transfer family protein [Amycolatopsis sp. H20-H5]